MDRDYFQWGAMGEVMEKIRIRTRRERLKSAPYLRLKSSKRDPLGLITIHSVAKYEKTRRGTLLRH